MNHGEILRCYSLPRLLITLLCSVLVAGTDRPKECTLCATMWLATSCRVQLTAASNNRQLLHSSQSHLSGRQADTSYGRWSSLPVAGHADLPSRLSFVRQPIRRFWPRLPLNPSRRRRHHRCVSVIYRPLLPDRQSLLLLRVKSLSETKARRINSIADDSQTLLSLQPDAQSPHSVGLGLSTSHHITPSSPQSRSAITFFHFRHTRFPSRSHLIIAMLSKFA